MRNDLKKLNSIYDLILWALPFVLALSYVFTRQHLHQGYPKNDAAEYAYSAQMLYTDYVNNNKKINFEKLYTIRDFRRTIYPLFIFINLLVFDGNLTLGLDFSALILWIMFLTYSLLICHNLIRGVAGLLTFYLIVTFPSFLSTAFTGTLELPLLACVSGICYHFLRSQNFSNVLHTHILGLLISIGTLFRPTELFAVLFGFYLYLIVKYRLITPVIGFIFIISAATKLNAPQPAILAALVIILIAMYIEFCFKELLKLSSLFLLPYLVLTTWYCTSFQSLWRWIYVNNFTSESAITGKRLGLSLYEFWFALYLRWGANTLILFSIATLYLLFRYKKNLKLKNFLLFCLPLLTLVFFGSFTNNGDPRYYYAGIFIVFIGFGFLKKNYYSYFANCLLLFAILLQMTFNYMEITNLEDRGSRKDVFSIIRPKHLWPFDPIVFYPETYEPLPSIAAELKSLLPEQERLRILVVSVQQKKMVQYLFEPVTLAVVAKDINHLHQFVPSPSNPLTSLEILRKEFDYILMGPLNLGFVEQQNDFVHNILNEYKISLYNIESTDKVKIFTADYRGNQFKYALIQMSYQR